MCANEDKRSNVFLAVIDTSRDSDVVGDIGTRCEARFQVLVLLQGVDLRIVETGSLK